MKAKDEDVEYINQRFQNYQVEKEMRLNEKLYWKIEKERKEIETYFVPNKDRILSRSKSPTEPNVF